MKTGTLDKWHAGGEQRFDDGTTENALTDQPHDLASFIASVVQRALADVSACDAILIQARPYIPKIRLRRKANGKPKQKPPTPRRRSAQPPSVPVTEGPASQETT